MRMNSPNMDYYRKIFGKGKREALREAVKHDLFDTCNKSVVPTKITPYEYFTRVDHWARENSKKVEDAVENIIITLTAKRKMNFKELP